MLLTDTLRAVCSTQAVSHWFGRGLENLPSVASRAFY
jgi:hypothetical protein